MNALDRILDDLSHRKNLDIYATILAALIVSILSYFELVPANKVPSVVLAMLAVLAFNTIATRTTVENTAREKPTGPPFLDDFPPDLRPRREASDNVYIAGVSLSRTLDTSYSAFERSLRRGGALRILLADPTADEAAVDARCQSSRPSADELREEIRRSLRQLSKLKETTNGNLEVKTTRAALKFSFNFVDASKANAKLYIQLYSYRLGGESRPLFTLTSADEEWFECFRYQAEALWNDGKPYILEDGASGQ